MDPQQLVLEIGLLRQQMDAAIERIARLEQRSLPEITWRREWAVQRPQYFDGSRKNHEALSWLYSVKEYMVAVELPAERTVSFVKALLTDRAVTWVRSLELQRSSELSVWEEFEHEFMQHFVSPVLAETARRELRSMMQSGSVSEFTHEFNKRLLEAGEVSPLLAKEYYLDGLKTEVQAWVRPQAPGSLQEAQVLAERVETVLKVSANGTPQLPITPPKPPYSGPASMQLGSMSVSGAATGNLEVTVNAGEGRKCFRCGQKGHIAKNCPQKH